MPRPTMTPDDFVRSALQQGVTIEIRGTLLTMSRRFDGTAQGFVAAETAVGLIYEAPQSRSGSTWGTDGGSIGGLSAVRSGCMVLHRSGVNRRWLAAVDRLQATAAVDQLPEAIPPRPVT